jgi:hypothetical protein
MGIVSIKKRNPMSAKKKVLISKAKLIQFAPTGEDSIVLNNIEGYLAKRYNKKRIDVDNADIIRYCINRVVEAIAIKVV